MKIFRSGPAATTPLDLLALAVAWVASIAVVNPLGDFPLNDDWALAQTVQRLLETGDYVPSSWLAMSMATNVLWGTLFCLPAGFSFDALRLSTLVLALLGMFGVYRLGTELRLSRALRLLAALTLGFNPIYYALSHTFLTDVPFTALLVLAALFFVRCLDDDSNRNLGIGIGLAVAATLSRQVGVALPLAFAVAYVLRFGFGPRALLRGIAPLAICVAALLAFQQWLAATGRLPPVYTQKTADLLYVLLTPRALVFEAMNAYVALLYFGLFLLPCLALLLPALWSQHGDGKISGWLAVVIVGGMSMLFTQYVAQPMLPMLGNVIDPSGLGPLTLRDTYILGTRPPALPRAFWSTLTWLGIAGAVLIVAAFTLFVARMAAGLRPGRTAFETAGCLFLLLAATAYLFAVFTGDLADRYLVPALPLLLLGFAGLYTRTAAPGRLFPTLGFVLLVAVALFSVATTRDYLTWNRLRWQALDELTRVDRVARSDIDGGFEFNAWYFYDPAYERASGKSWWWVQGDTYLISFQDVLGYSAVKEYTYTRWLPPYTATVRVLKKDGAAAPAGADFGWRR